MTSHYEEREHSLSEACLPSCSDRQDAKVKREGGKEKKKKAVLGGLERVATSRREEKPLSHAKGPDSYARLAAHFTTFAMIIVVVIGPTPPGTGVIRLAFAATAS